MTINRVELVGRFGSDPDLRQTASGTAILSMRLAVPEFKSNKQTGQTEEYTNWIDCSMFGARAENVAKHVRKGDKVAVAGRLRYSQWEKDGQKHSKLEVVADDVEFMSQKQQPQQAPQYMQQAAPQGYPTQYPVPQQYQAPQQAPQYAAPQQAPQYQAPQTAPQMQMPAMYDEDIPFGG